MADQHAWRISTNPPLLGSDPLILRDKSVYNSASNIVGNFIDIPNGFGKNRSVNRKGVHR